MSGVRSNKIARQPGRRLQPRKNIQDPTIFTVTLNSFLPPLFSTYQQGISTDAGRPWYEAKLTRLAARAVHRELTE